MRGRDQQIRVLHHCAFHDQSQLRRVWSQPGSCYIGRHPNLVATPGDSGPDELVQVVVCTLRIGREAYTCRPKLREVERRDVSVLRWPRVDRLA